MNLRAISRPASTKFAVMPAADDLYEACKDLARDVAEFAERCFARSNVFTDADWQQADLEGYERWKNCLAAIARWEAK